MTSLKAFSYSVLKAPACQTMSPRLTAALKASTAASLGQTSAFRSTAEPEWWGVAEAASHCGIRPATWRDYVASGHAPTPDRGVEEWIPKNRRTPQWRPETVTAWHASRPRPGIGGRRSPTDIT